MIDIREIIEELNLLDETTTLEAKQCLEHVDKSFYETVCAFSNEPDLGGGIVLLGLKRDDERAKYPVYDAVGVNDADQLSLEIASGCATRFNQPIRPEIHSETINGKTVLAVQIPELSPASKPVYFKNRQLPAGAFRRIGSSDQHCTEEDLSIFYGEQNIETLDTMPMPGASFDDIDLDAIDRYRKLRERANPEAEELNWSDQELLQALGALKIEGEVSHPTYAGILLFGTRHALRRLFPMFRMDYIRVPGNRWIEDPDNRFTTVDMRDTLISLVQRVQNLVFEDLPKEFHLKEGEIQADPITIPVRALREAIVNAVMHRDYRPSSPIQVIRYTNRIEIRNPGYSLINEELFGEPGSKTRNPHIASVFHDINFAETKGSGIRIMRRLMEQNGFAPPTFESNRIKNEFISRFLLHHFLDESDLRWLEQFKEHKLTREQQFALIFVREQGAIDNLSLFQLTELTLNDAKRQLRKLKDLGFVERNGKGRGTYYIATPLLLADHVEFGADRKEFSAYRREFKTNREEFEPNREEFGANREEFDIPKELKLMIAELGVKPRKEQLQRAVLRLCRWKTLNSAEIAHLLGGRHVRNLIHRHITPMLRKGLLKHTFPNMINHPRQAYKITEKGKSFINIE